MSGHEFVGGACVACGAAVAGAIARGSDCPGRAPSLEPAPMRRANWLPAPAAFELNQACAQINAAFGSFGCFLVGSALVRREHRDVDVRYIMEDAAFDRLFEGMQGAPEHDPRWSLLCCSISLWLREKSGLPVDFQIQRASHANAEFHGSRHALGILLDRMVHP